MGGASVAVWLTQAGSLAIKSLIVFLVAAVILLTLRRASAATRHLVCLLTLAALLALPVLSLVLPGWRLIVLPVPAASRKPTPLLRDESLRFAPSRAKRGGSWEAAVVLPSSPLPAEEGGEERAGRDRSVPLPHPFPWPSALAALWLLGFVLAGLRPLLGLWGIALLSRQSEPLTDASTLALASECGSALGLKVAPALRQAAAPVPMTWGWWRPVALLPLGAPAWPKDRLRAVLLHELAHVRRCDWLGHRFADFVCAVYWFHPFAWLTARRLRLESESACDDLVLASGVAAPDYARHLLDVARALHPISAVPQAAIAMARTSRLEGRLKMILDSSRPRRALTRRVLLLVLTPGVAGLTTLAMLHPAVRAQTVPLPVAAPPALPSTVPIAAPHTRFLIGQHLRRASAAPLPVADSKSMPPVPPLAAKSQTSPLSLEPVSVVPTTAASDAAPLPMASVALPKGLHYTPARYNSLFYNVPIRLVVPIGPVRISTDGMPPLLSVDNLKLNGVSLLAGVTDADKPGSPWWSATGAVLPTPVYDMAAYKAERHPSGRADRRSVVFAFRLPGSAQDVTVQYELPQSLGSSSDGFWPTKIAENAHRTEAQLFSRTNGSRVVTAEFPASLSKTDIRVGVATGPWKLAASYAPIPGGFGNIDVSGNAKFLFSPVAETKDGTIQSIATDATEDLRVVAVDKQGKETLPLLVGGNSAGGLDQITARFALPLAQIKEIHVETRPFQWIELKDVALQPAQ